MTVTPKKKAGLTILEICIFAVFGGLMFASKVAMASLPNIHLLALFIISFTVVYRVKALVPIYVYVLLEGIVYGFTPWWIPYLYIWTVLWGVTMLIPRKWPVWLRAILYCVAGGLHGLLFGTLFAPVQALIFNLNWKGMLAWIASGFYFDVIHGISNAVLCTLCIPLIKLLKLMKSKIRSEA